MQPEVEPCLLVIISDLAIRNSLVDWLLSYQNELVFTSATIDCYGLDPKSLNLAEQVTGRQRTLEFQIQTTVEMARDICKELRLAFPGAHLRYWIQPVLETGYLDHATDQQLVE